VEHDQQQRGQRRGARHGVRRRRVHADAPGSVRRPSHYFPVHAATAHAMAGAATLTTLLLIVFHG